MNRYLGFLTLILLTLILAVVPPFMFVAATNSKNY